ncbi:hypothetical protein CP97_11025 [Aurantiacibacter atlanticus]|uniref:PRC-barrel domain-containing protein n=1 Tax=Aurantiacibacter atlanticus TaxID=1648404 RepID=A0A0H4VZ39_9SPHN|nr:hypothetical protein [Aurantiacibacter atlanticus]AKQ42448.1 hypothetical protein CP97_11025 [Aurantiacibacter atlanticus]MDF1834703.1 hypothetical protein [Alteraurantiacibacter sp. bin_em_oilr2.035]
MNRFALTAAAAMATAFAAPAMAQDAGVTIVGNDDIEIGTVASNDGSTVVVDTGTHQIPLGTDAFAEREGVWTLNTTKVELDTAWAQIVAEQEAALAAAIVVGADVITADAQALGTIETVNADDVVLTHADQPMTLPKNLLALDEEGKLMVLANMADIMAAVGG